MTLDQTDFQILAILQENGRIPAAEVARRVNMAPSAIFERIRRLEERGIIASYSANLNPSAMGMSLLAFVYVTADGHVADEEPGMLLARVPGVQEVHHIAGQDSYLVKIRAKDPETLGKILREHFGKIRHVRSTRTTVVLETIKHTAALPIALDGVVQS